MACPPNAPGRWIALPGAWMLAEAFRGRWPFGGVPVSRLAMGQVDSPLVHVVRLGGTLLLDLVTVAVGRRDRGRVRAAAGGSPSSRGVLVAGVVVWGALAPTGHDIGSLRVALVQGGGPQGTRFFETDPSIVFQRHVDATDAVQQPVDIVLWPEDVVNIEGPVTNSHEGRCCPASLAGCTRPCSSASVEGDGNRFHNAQVAIDPEGNFVDRYEKVRRVPFGEYVPLRGLLKPFAGSSLIERDALVGTGPAILQTPAGTFGVSESWEIFFPDRTRAAIRAGGEVLLNPTNGASFHGSIVQTQQIAASRLAAIANGRWVAAGGADRVHRDHRSGRHGRAAHGHQRAPRPRGDVQRRTGETIATRVGDWPALILAFGLVGPRLARARRPASASGLEEDRDRAVVDERDVHLGAEPSGRDAGAEVSQTGDDRVDEGLGLLGPGGGDPRGSPAP